MPLVHRDPVLDYVLESAPFAFTRLLSFGTVGNLYRLKRISVLLISGFNNGETPTTPWKINMEHKNGGLEDDFPFQFGVF